MIRAAARGVIDFARFDPNDRRWWTRLRWLLDAWEADEFLKYLELQTLRHASALSPSAGSQWFDHYWKSTGKIVDAANDLLFPWNSKSGKTGRIENVDAMYKQLVKTFGDPKDPEVAARIDRAVAASKAARQPVAKPEQTRKRKKK